MKPLPKTANPLIVRTDFENQQAWEAICELVGSPAHFGDDGFPAHIECLEDGDDRGLCEQEISGGCTKELRAYSFFFVVDEAAGGDPECPILGRGLRPVSRP